MRAILATALGVMLAACASLPATRRTPFLPPGVFGVYQDNDLGAIDQSAWAFASPANTRGNPVDAAKAIVALEYLSGELRENPRWAGMDEATKFRIGQARDELRRVVGIRPGTPPQLVVNALLQLAWDLQTGNQPVADQVLASAVFVLPPSQTLQVLSNLPYEQTANLATSRAQDQALPPGGARS